MIRTTVKIALTLLLLGFPAAFLSAPIPIVNATDVSGVISEDVTWAQADSPYIVTSDVTIGTNATLTIQPGVEVRFNANYSLTVNGSLFADGTEANRIVFTSNNPEPKPGDWNTLKFAGSGGESFALRHCLMEFATNGVTIESQQRVVIENSELTNNSNSGIHVMGQSNFLARENVIRFNENGITGSGDIISGIVVSNNSILYNDKYGIYLKTNGSLAYPRAPISNIVISDNNVSYNEYGIHLSGFTTYYSEFGSYISNVTVSRNTVYFNDYGIYFKTWGFYDTSMYNIEISHNHVFFGKYGIYFEAGGSWYRRVYEVTVSHNIVASNEMGMYIEHAHHNEIVTFDATIVNNTFSSNFVGISLDWETKVNLTRNSISYNGHGVQLNVSTGNLARYNDFYENILYGMYVTENATVDAEYNYWGDATGPSHELNPEGRGDGVNGDGVDLDYQPFIENALGDINEPPVASFEVNRKRVAVDQAITVNASLSTDDKNVGWYLFDFGDGTNSSWSTSPFLTHTYSSAGNYTVILVVIDDLGVRSRNYMTAKVTVTSGLVPLVVLIYNNASIFVFPGQATALSIRVTDGDSPMPGASVTVSSNSSGTFSVATGVTDANGYFNTTFIAPAVTTQMLCVIAAEATKTEYGDAQGQIEIVLMPAPREDGGFNPLVIVGIVAVVLVVVILYFVKKR